MANSRGVRLSDEDDKEINQIMQDTGFSFSALISHIVHDWLHSRRSKQERGDITLAAEPLKNFLKNVDKKQLKKIADANAKYIIEEMKFQVDDLDFEELSRRILEWNKENDLRMVRKNRKESVMFVQRHHLGHEWSIHQSMMYAKMFEIIGETIVPNSIKNDRNSFSFEVIRHSSD